MPIVENEQCNKAYKKTTTIGISQMCVGGVVGMDSCGGDSGGPLQKVKYLKYLLIYLFKYLTKMLT